MANLITLDEYKTFAGINSIEQDEMLESLITQLSSLIKTYCGRDLIDWFNDDKEEYFSGGVNYYFPLEFPINEISKVEYSIDNGATWTVGVKNTDWYYDIAKQAIYVPTGSSLSTVNGLKVTYTGGYETTPEDLKLAFFDLIQFYTRQESNPKKTLGFISVEYITSPDFPSHIKRVLALYRAI